jgi:hypothetical protein
MNLDTLSDAELGDLEERLAEEKKLRSERDQLNPMGLWRVTTEGDEEGRTVRSLGIHEGHLGEIMLALSPATFYSLAPQRVYPPKIEADRTVTHDSANMSYYDLFGHIKPEEAIPKVQRLLGARFKVSKGQYYCSVKITKVK